MTKSTQTGQAKEEEYAGYLDPDALTSLPVATTIGNHDSLNADYMYHFNNPNTTEYGATQAGGDYYYSYGNGLFIVLNTNNYNVAEHKKAIEEAVASDPDAAWRIVTIHQDIYGTGLDHSDTDGMILRTQLTPIFDEFDIDVVLQGHDHTLQPFQAAVWRWADPRFLRVPTERRRLGLRLGPCLSTPPPRPRSPGPGRRGC
ncbi:MAG: metallophosphoesterase family protein [Flavonifractor plautii]